MQNCARSPWLNNSSSNTTPRDRDHRPQVAFLIITSHKHYPRFHREWFCDAAERSEEEVARPDPEGKPSREGKRDERRRERETKEARGSGRGRSKEKRERQRGKLRRNKTTRRESEGEREKERAGVRTKRRLGTNHEKSRWNLNFAQTCAFRCVYLDTPPAHALCTHPFRKKLVSGRWEPDDRNCVSKLEMRIHGLPRLYRFRHLTSFCTNTDRRWMICNRGLSETPARASHLILGTHLAHIQNDSYFL